MVVANCPRRNSLTSSFPTALDLTVAVPATHSHWARYRATLLGGSQRRGARAAGFPTGLWTCPRVAELIHHHWGVRYHVDHIGRLLRSLGWTPQKPPR